MKIKTKKVITEKEYLHYIIDKSDFLSISHDFTHVDHDIVHSDIMLELHDRNNTTYANTWVDSEGETVFEVEVEEEITEDTELDLIERFIGGKDYVCYTSQRATIKECLKRSPRDCTTTHFYIENDDRELILIWRDGKLI